MKNQLWILKPLSGHTKFHKEVAHAGSEVFVMLVDRSIGGGLDSLEWVSGRVLAAKSGRITVSRNTTRAITARRPSGRGS
jgi:hypothetical protein